MPRKVDYPGPISKIATGVNHSCAINPFGKLLVWGANRLCQLGYPRGLKEVYKPVLCSGQIQSNMVQDVTAPSDSTITDNFIGKFRYLDIKCSGSLSVAVVSHAPYLLIWGNDVNVAWGLPDLIKDKPLGFKCVGASVYVLTRDGMFKIDAKTKQYKILGSTDGVYATMDQDLLQFESGLDFQLTLKTSRNVYAQGGNSYG